MIDCAVRSADLPGGGASFPLMAAQTTPPNPAGAGSGPGQSARPGASGIYYGWYIVAATGFVMTIATVPLFHAMTLWAVALEKHFMWPRGQLSLALTLTRIEGGLMGPLEGYLTDKLGGRLMVLMGFIILGIGFLFFWQIDAGFWPVAPLYMFYFAYMVMALGQGLGSWVPMMTTINNWFSRRMASAMGWANFMSRGGALIVIPLIDLGINGSIGIPFTQRTVSIGYILGWEGVALALAIVIFAAAVPLSLLIRNKPEDMGLYPDGAAAPSTRGGRTPAIPQGLTAQQAIRTSAFWLIAVGHGMTSMIILAIFTHLGLLLKDAGFEQYAGTVVILYTVVSMFAQPLGGYAGDRFPKRIGLFIFTTIQATAVLLLTYSTELWMFYTFAVIFGIGFGGRNPLTTSIRGEYFGRGNFGKILGISTIPMNGLLLISSPFAGYMYDWQGSYTIALLVLAACNYAGGVCFLFARRPRLPAVEGDGGTVAATGSA